MAASVLVLTVNAVDVSAITEWEMCSFVQMAAEGAYGSGTLVLRDVPGTFVPRYNQAVLLTENGTVVWRGRVGPDDFARDSVVDHFGPRRIVTMTIEDANFGFDEKSIDGYKRPSEADTDRIKAAFAKYRASIDTTTYVSATGAVTMDIASYPDVVLRDLVADCSADGDRNYWIDRTNSLHYVTPAGGAAWTGSISFADAGFSRDATDGSSTVFNIGLLTKREDPKSIPILTRLTLKYGLSRSKKVTVNDGAAQAIYGIIEGPPVYDDRTLSSASATRRANALLRRSANPEPGYDTTVAIPQLNMLDAGRYYNLTSAPLGLSSTAKQLASFTARRKGDAAAGYWEADLSFENPLRLAQRGKGFKSSAVRQGANTTPGNLVLGSITDTFNRVDQTGLGFADCGYPWDGVNDAFCSIFNNTAYIGSGSDNFDMTDQMSGVLPFPLNATIKAVTFDGLGFGCKANGGAIDVDVSYNVGATNLFIVTLSDGVNSTTIQSAITVTRPCFCQLSVGPTFVSATIDGHGLTVSRLAASPAPIALMTATQDWRLRGITSGGNSSRWDNLDITGLSNLGSFPATFAPAYVGMTYGPVTVSVGDGVTSTFLLPGGVGSAPGPGYINGSLEVMVDGLQQPVTETSPAAGYFTLGFAPTDKETITAIWRPQANNI